MTTLLTGTMKRYSAAFEPQGAANVTTLRFDGTPTFTGAFIDELLKELDDAMISDMCQIGALSASQQLALMLLKDSYRLAGLNKQSRGQDVEE